MGKWGSRWAERRDFRTSERHYIVCQRRHYHKHLDIVNQIHKHIRNPMFRF